MLKRELRKRYASGAERRTVARPLLPSRLTDLRPDQGVPWCAQRGVRVGRDQRAARALDRRRVAAGADARRRRRRARSPAAESGRHAARARDAACTSGRVAGRMGHRLDRAGVARARRRTTPWEALLEPMPVLGRTPLALAVDASVGITALLEPFTTGWFHWPGNPVTGETGDQAVVGVRSVDRRDDRRPCRARRVRRAGRRRVARVRARQRGRRFAQSRRDRCARRAAS